MNKSYSKKLFFVLFISTFFSILLLNRAHAIAKNKSGKLTLIYVKGNSKNSRRLEKTLKEIEIFEELIGAINESFILPRNINVRVQNCDEANAYYDPEEREIIMCYEMIDLFEEVFSENYEDEEEIGQHIVNATVFIFLHELGHALVDQLDIPVTGKEEDAVDDLASLLLLQDDEDGSGAELVASAAEHFAAMADEISEEDELAFWDEHSLDAQRVYSILCLIYGSNPKKHRDLVGETLPEERADRCPAEFKQKSRSWEKLLEKHMR